MNRKCNEDKIEDVSSINSLTNKLNELTVCIIELENCLRALVDDIDEDTIREYGVDNYISLMNQWTIELEDLRYTRDSVIKFMRDRLTAERNTSVA